MKRQLLTIGAFGALALTACVPQSPDPQIGQPGYCGQTADGRAIVALHVDLGSCTPVTPGQLRISVRELCGPIMPGSSVADDCYRGAIPGIPSPDVFRLGTLQAAPGSQVIAFVASDATAT